LSERRGILSDKSEEMIEGWRKWNNKELNICLLFMKYYHSDKINQKVVGGN
jgi:hypothetical protein